ncbi:MAG: hypothetical protein V4454_00745 [Pseudomonadota bacterium]
MQPQGKDMAPAIPAGRNPGLVARFRQRLFPGNSSGSSPSLPQSPDKLKAGIAELLLVNRLMARSTRKAQATEMLDRASHIVFVTCKNWFSSADARAPERRTPL